MKWWTGLRGREREGRVVPWRTKRKKSGKKEKEKREEISQGHPLSVSHETLERRRMPSNRRRMRRQEQRCVEEVEEAVQGEDPEEAGLGRRRSGARP